VTIDLSEPRLDAVEVPWMGWVWPRRASAARLVASIGEPVMAAYGRVEVDALLRAAAFNHAEFLDAAGLSHRYLHGRRDRTLPASTVIVIAAT
jgi:hypothetical protein